MTRSLRLVASPARRLVGLRAVAVAIAIVVMLVSPRSFADEAAARAHFKKGIDLYDRKQFAEALAEFQEAYKEKPSPGIKQNIALSLKGLNRPAEAATSFDEALDEGKGTLKPDTRAAMERELAELTRIVATVHLTVVTEDKLVPEDKHVVSGAIVSIEPAGEPARSLAPDAHRRPIRLMPGIYTFRTHVAGYPDPPEKKLALVSGAPVDATFVVGDTSQMGTLTIQPSVPNATISVDGREVGREKWSGLVSAGTHRIDVTAPGMRTTTLDVDVTRGAVITQPVKLVAIGDEPPEYVAHGTKAPKRKRFYVLVSGALDTVSYRLGVPLDEPAPYGTRRSDFFGPAIGARLGLFFDKLIAAELLTEVGVVGAKYKVRPSDALESETGLFHWQITPVVRFVSPGKVRFTAGVGVGVHGLAVESKLARPGITVTKKGSGVGASLLLDTGIQVDIGPIYLEGALFLDVHGVGPVRDNDPPEDRFFYASPATRGGLRLGLGIPF